MLVTSYTLFRMMTQHELARGAQRTHTEEREEKLPGSVMLSDLCECEDSHDRNQRLPRGE